MMSRTLGEILEHEIEVLGKAMCLMFPHIKDEYTFHIIINTDKTHVVKVVHKDESTIANIRYWTEKIKDKPRKNNKNE